jgi:hypothetical protein
VTCRKKKKKESNNYLAPSHLNVWLRLWLHALHGFLLSERKKSFLRGKEIWIPTFVEGNLHFPQKSGGRKSTFPETRRYKIEAKVMLFSL